MTGASGRSAPLALLGIAEGVHQSHFERFDQDALPVLNS
jgi:hypothetical protein